MSSEDESRFRVLVDSQTDLVCRYRPDTTLTFVNQAYCRYFDREADDLIGTSFLDLIPEPARAGAQSCVDRLLTTNHTEFSEHEVSQPDGQTGWQQWSDYLLFDSRGTVAEIQAVGRDITQFKHAQLQLEQHQRELIQLGRLAMLGKMTTTLAHELSHPIATILAATQTLEHVLRTPSIDLPLARDIVHDLLDQSHRGAAVVQKLRALFRNGKVATELLDLNTIVLDAVDFANVELRTSRTQVRFALAQGLPRIAADRILLQQVLLNLILNARDAMLASEQKREVVITTSQNDALLECSIADSGVGIPAADLPKIFEAFFTTKHDGIGLGLSISRSIIAAHGGSLWARNNPAGGTMVHFTLPTTANARRSSISLSS